MVQIDQSDQADQVDFYHYDPRGQFESKLNVTITSLYNYNGTSMFFKN